MPSESLWESIKHAGPPDGRLHGIRHVIRLADLEQATSLGSQLEKLRDKSIVLLARDQLTAALALIELDGVARRMVLCPPDVAAEHLPAIVQDAEADACVVDETAASGQLGIGVSVHAVPRLTRRELPLRRSRHDLAPARSTARSRRILSRLRYRGAR